jgi:DNA-binding LacI/PurR family transcriptional regulator
MDSVYLRKGYVHMASMKDVAKLAGVSVSTVSRVISNSIPVDEKTREKVERAIEAVNFKPNLLAQGLRSKSGNIIGLIVPEILHESFIYFIKYIERYVSEIGFNLIIGNTSNKPKLESEIIDNMIRRNVDGIIFSRVSDKSKVMRIIEKTDIPVVIIDRALGQEDIPTVVLDNYDAGRLCAEHLVALGHEKFACITGPRDIFLSRDRLRGFVDVLKKNGLGLPESNIFEGDFKFETGKKGMQYFLETGAEFTAIWGQNDLMAIGAMNELVRRGRRIPDDISVVGMDNINAAEMLVPSLTTITQPFEEMARISVDMILKERNGETIPEKRVVLSPGILIRETTSRARIAT